MSCMKAQAARSLTWSGGLLVATIGIFSSVVFADTIADPKIAAAGDQWTYDVTDETTNTPSASITYTVTEVSKNETSTSVERLEGNGKGLAVFTGTWGLKQDNIWKNDPDDGLGLNFPLVVGKQWSVHGSNKNLLNGSGVRHLGASKVTSEEKLDTPAGEFLTFKIVSDLKWVGANGQGQKAEIHVETWYSPEINRVVKRTFLSKLGGHILAQTSIILTDNSPTQN